MIRIALVGSIGSGKTFISNLFGYPVFNADESVSKIYSTNKKIFYKLNKKLHKFFTEQPVKKKELIKAILENKNSLNIISKIVHPEVRKDLQKFMKKHNKKKAIVLDIPLLFENKLNKKKDVIIYIQSPNYEVLKRLKKRKNFNNLVFKKLKKISFVKMLKIY